jgi:hypothetical protein
MRHALAQERIGQETDTVELQEHRGVSYVANDQ